MMHHPAAYAARLACLVKFDAADKSPNYRSHHALRVMDSLNAVNNVGHFRWLEEIHHAERDGYGNTKRLLSRASSLLRVGLLEVSLGIFRVDGQGARRPVGGADFAMLLDELQSVEDTQGFVGAAAERQVVDQEMADDALGVDEEQSTERDAGIFEQHAVIAADLLGQVGHERVLESAQAAVDARGLDPGEVGEVAIDRDTQDLTVPLLEFGDFVAESDDFRRADEGKIERVEEETNVLAAKIGEADRLEFFTDDGGGGEIRGFFLNSNRHLGISSSVSQFSIDAMPLM